MPSGGEEAAAAAGEEACGDSVFGCSLHVAAVVDAPEGVAECAELAWAVDSAGAEWDVYYGFVSGVSGV